MHCKKNSNKLIKYFLFTIVVVTVRVGFAQAPTSARAAIEKALSEEDWDKADALTKKQINAFYAAKNIDSLNEYIFYIGKIAQEKEGAEAAVKKTTLFIEKIKTLKPAPVKLRQTYLNAGEVYGMAGKKNGAYKANEEALRFTLLMPDKTGGDLGLVENNLSTYAQRMGDLHLSAQHGRTALKHLLSDATVNYERLYISYNSMGTIMWYASKLDSALHYFNKAAQALEKTPHTPLNQYYRVAIIQNNVSAIYALQGKITESINALKQCINNNKSFLLSKEPHPKKAAATELGFEAIDNLAGKYKDLGDYKQAQNLLTYSYQQKQAQLDKDDPAIFISQILLGQLFYATKEFDKSLQYLTNGLTKIAASGGDYLFWQADACNTLALLYDAKHNIKQADYYYEKADALYEESLQGAYDNIYLDFIRNAALFYAENKQPKIALSKANKGFNYILKAEGTGSLPHFYQLLNLAEVHFAQGAYNKALEYANKGIKVINTISKSSSNALDSIHTEIKKPKAILIKAKSQYSLLTVKNVVNLTAIQEELKEALNILEKRKTVIHDPQDIGLMMADHTELLEFIKKITLDLFTTTDAISYADELIGLHESGIYNRIRSRLNKSHTAQFAHLPADVSQKENQLKEAVTAALNSDGTHDQKIGAYIQSVDNWNNYLSQLKVQYPRYYKMRYASIFHSVNELQPFFPQQTTIIRYFFVGDDLMALITDRTQKKLIKLSSTNLERSINALSEPMLDIKKGASILHSLHQQLWAPLEKDILYNKVIIIPDGILFNFNFEILTPKKIQSFKELGTGSLLSKHTISYQYSLFLLAPNVDVAPIARNFVAFVPGFSDDNKQQYRSSREGSPYFDAAYLTLLPQPFTLSLAQKVQKMLGGNSYINNESTLRSFKNNAGSHKIIHIGTHAEANNFYPEFSRLIFAKDTGVKEEANSLYLFDIYNCDLRSNLTVLTACESGKPGYKDGEGMISLAHAFNYAGSESIITGLWKIDEQSSAVLMDLFYKYILDGMPKDEALRLAKLSYLKNASGRALAPQYWAGLVLMGDTTPLQIEQPKSKVWLLLLFIALGSGTIYLFKRKIDVRKQHQSAW